MHRKSLLWKRILGLTLSVAMLMSQPVVFAAEPVSGTGEASVVVAEEETGKGSLPEATVSDNAASEAEMQTMGKDPAAVEDLAGQEAEAKDLAGQEAAVEEAKGRQLTKEAEITILQDTGNEGVMPKYPERGSSLTPLSNLAEGVPIYFDDGSYVNTVGNQTEAVANGSTTNKAAAVAEAHKIVNGDKYDDTLLNEKSNSSIWMGETQYITFDLGASYHLEVINLKRAYKRTFPNTAIVLSEDKDFTTGQVIYYQTGMEEQLKEFEITATEAEAPYEETYGGDWFYMAGNGYTATEPGTTKKARYVRIYSDDPAVFTNKTDATAQKENGFVEVQIWGYDREERMAEKREYKKYSAQNPLIINPLYSSSRPYAGMEMSGDRDLNEGLELYVIGEEGPPEYKHGETIQGRWNSIPQELKEHSVLLLHTDNLGMKGGTQWNRIPRNIHKRQQLYQDFNERGLEEAYKNDVPVMLIAVTASAVPLETLDDNGRVISGTSYNACAAADYGWMDLMYRVYPNFKGTFNPENHWSGSFGAVAAASGMALEMAALHNGYFVWSESVDTLENSDVKNSRRWTNSFQEHGDEHLYMVYKSTGAVGGRKEYPTASYMQGMWLGGYAAGWGGLIDTWSWSNVNQGDYGNTLKAGDNMWWNGVAAYPEAMMGAQLISLYLEGAAVYTFEHPAVTNGVNNENTPMYEHVIEKCFEYFLRNPGPSKNEILEKTQFITYGNIYANPQVFQNLVGNTSRNYFLYGTGRYGIIPAITNFKSKEQVAADLNAYCTANQITAPALLDVNDPNITGNTKLALFNNAYEKEYSGDAFADIWNDLWWVYNNDYDPDDVEKTQTATIPLTQEKDGQINDTPRLKATLKAHSYFITDTKVENNSISLHLNNYRTNKSGLFNKGQSWRDKGWTGSGYELYDIISWRPERNDLAEESLDSQEHLAPTDASKQNNRYNYNGGAANLWSAGLWDFCEAYIANPLDTEMRQTVFEISQLEKAPTVTIADAQEWNETASNSPQIKGNGHEQGINEGQDTIKVEFANGTATITVESNGWVDLNISDLSFVQNQDAEDVTKEEAEADSNVGTETDLAKDASLSISAMGSSDRPLSLLVNGTTTGDRDYVDTVNNDGKGDWLELDLLGQHKIDSVQLWRYNGDTRSYKDTIVLLSPTADFNPATTLVLWNAYDNASQVTWFENSGDHSGFMAALQKLRTADWTASGNGQDELVANYDHDIPASGYTVVDNHDYNEKAEGYTFSVANARIMLDGFKALRGAGEEYEINTMAQEQNQAKDRFTARYVRIYSNGRTDSGDQTHFQEVKVNGIKGKNDGGEIIDTQGPNGPFNLKFTKTGSTTGTVSFDAASDNISRDLTYEVTVTEKVPSNEILRETAVGKTSYEVSNLEAGKTYVVTVVVRDESNNENTVTQEFEVSGKKIESIQVVTQPRLVYTEGDSLDLTGLTVKAVYSDDTEEELSHEQLDFLPANGTKLSLADDGREITITLRDTEITAKTEPLTVTKAEVPTPPEELVYPDDIWVAGITGDNVYTGSKILHDIVVYDGDVRLKEKVDYTISYKNNTNAQEWDTEGDGIYVESLKAAADTFRVLNEEGSEIYTLSEGFTGIEENQADKDMPSNLKKAPQVTIKMKGNYKGSHTIYFEINKADIGEATADDLSATFVKAGKLQTPKPVVTLYGKKLTMGKDFDVKEYVEKDPLLAGKADERTEVTLTLRGLKNYGGEKNITLTIGKKDAQVEEISMSKISVKGVVPVDFDKEQAGTEDGIRQKGFTVSYKKDKLEDVAIHEQGEYYVEYEANDRVGTASMILIGTGEDRDNDNKAYVGVKRVTFKIKGTDMKKVKVEGLDKNYPYTGEPVEPLDPAVDSDTRVTLNGAPLTEGYYVDYEKNINKGTATIILTGIEEEGFAGVKKQTFKIWTDTIDTNTAEEKEKFEITIIDEAAVVKEEGMAMPFTKGGVTPLVEVTDPQGEVLTEGEDYTVSYKNNKKLGSLGDGKKAPKVVVKGKGNYEGTAELPFTIIQKDVTVEPNHDDLTVVLTDKTEVSKVKKDSWKSKVKVVDQDGKALSATEAKIKEAKYYLEELPANMEGISNADKLEDMLTQNTELSAASMELIPAGTRIKVVVELSGNYSGTAEGSYRIIREGFDISKATIKLQDQVYTGEALEIDESSDIKSAKIKGKDVKNQLILEEGEGQTLEVVEGSYVKNVAKGTAKVTLRGVNEYGGTKTVTFKIVQRDISTILEGIYTLVFG